MPTSILFIGDPHFQVSNIIEVDMFIERIVKLALEKKETTTGLDFVIVAGDLLHTHERLHTIALNKAYELIRKLRDIVKTYVLVGNHDYIQNQQYLTTNHWMNGMKEWDNVEIIDTVVKLETGDSSFIFTPYVPNGRFIDALNTLNNESWKDVSCIFAHQEFAGCKMGAIVSIDGDKWLLDYPHVVSGHIHSRQTPQKNVYYSGSAMQHAFGESEKNIIAYFQFTGKEFTLDEIDLKLPRKKIIYMDVKNIDSYEAPETEDKIKVTVSGDYEQFKALKKTKKYKELMSKGVKVIFKPKKIDKLTKNKEQDNYGEDTDFQTILSSLINNEKNPYLSQAYELVVNGKEVSEDDFMFV